MEMDLATFRTKVEKKARHLYERCSPYIPPTITSRVDHLIPSIRESWGGPVNGQVKRAEIFRGIFAALRFDAVVETGTFRGTTTEFLRAASGRPVYTVEVSPRFFLYSRHRFRHDEGVHVSQGDSRPFLRGLRAKPALADATLFFYLDAHWNADLPLREEVHFILESWRNAVIAIDDFEVPGEPLYGFDDYGPESRLTIPYLRLSETKPARVFWPTAGGAEETGARRGCVVLATPGIAAEALARLPTLREGSASASSDGVATGNARSHSP